MSEALRRFNRWIRGAKEAEKKTGRIPDEVKEEVTEELDGRLGPDLICGTVAGVRDGISRKEAEEEDLLVD